MTSKNAKSRNYPLIPEEEHKCIWMTTGLISYKLCDKDYQCEICPFDQAIKHDEKCESNFQDLGEDWMEGSPQKDPSAQINGSIFYHPDHCWVKVEDHEKAKIGIDNLLTQLITDVKMIILPQVGSFASQGECYAYIILEDYILPVISPLSGSIQTVNPRLKKEPELIIDDPRGEGWLLTIRPGNLERDLKNLLFGKKALLWYQREEKEIIARADFMLKHNPDELGPTMQDGGVRIKGLHDMLHSINAKQKTKILDSSFARPKNSKRIVESPQDKFTPHGK
jgi:glycine cleavage system H protein